MFGKGTGARRAVLAGGGLLLLLSWVGAAYGGWGSVPVGENMTWSDKRMALTFDDGPRRETTTALLDGLAQRGVKATFFLITDQVPGNEDLVERMLAEGHQVGIHTAGHQCLVGVDDATFTAQVQGAREALEELTDGEKLALRPPYGLLDQGVRTRAGSPLILWSVDPEDWKYKDPERIREWIVSHAGDGEVVLLHDIYPTSVAGALAAVDELEQAGYRFVTVEDLAAERGVELVDGEAYSRFPPAGREKE